MKWLIAATVKEPRRRKARLVGDGGFSSPHLRSLERWPVLFTSRDGRAPPAARAQPVSHSPERVSTEKGCIRAERVIRGAAQQAWQKEDASFLYRRPPVAAKALTSPSWAAVV